MARLSFAECAFCAGSIRVKHGLFFHDVDSPHADITTPVRKVRCTVPDHKDCRVTIEAGQVKHSAKGK